MILPEGILEYFELTNVIQAENGLNIEIVYFDEGRLEHRTSLKIVDGTVENNKII